MGEYDEENGRIRHLLVRMESAIASRDTAALHEMLAPYVNLDMSAVDEGEAGTRPCETVIHGWLEDLNSRPWQLHAFEFHHDKPTWSRVSAQGHAVRGCDGCDRQGRWDFVLRLEDGAWRINRYRFLPTGVKR